MSDKKCYQIAGQFGISPNTFSKYMRSCLERGLCNSTPNGHKQFIGLDKCVAVLLCDGDVDEFRKAKHIEFFRGIQGLKTVRDYQNMIELAFLKREHDKQIFSSNRDYEAFLILSGVSVQKGTKYKKRLLNKLMKKFDLTSYGQVWEYLKLKCQNSPKSFVTGKNHLSSKIGFSASTAVNRLRGWNNNGFIKRSVVYINTGLSLTHNSYDYLKEFSQCLIPCYRRGVYIDCKGSRVELANMPKVTVSVK